MCSCIWLAPPRLAFFLAICGVGHPLSIVVWFNNKVVVVVVVVVLVFVNSGKCRSISNLKFPEIQTRIFLQMESAIGLSLASAF